MGHKYGPSDEWVAVESQIFHQIWQRLPYRLNLGLYSEMLAFRHLRYQYSIAQFCTVRSLNYDFHVTFNCSHKSDYFLNWINAHHL
jgi:hypothetical protein